MVREIPIDRGPVDLADAGRLRLVIPNKMEAVGEANRTLERFLEDRKVPPDVSFSATLVLEEVTTNVIKYSYEDRKDHEILVQAHLDKDCLVLSVTDDGREFDPRRAASPDFEKPLEERPIGGLGIHLLRNLAERMDYQRLEGKNTLTVFLSLRPKD